MRKLLVGLIAVALLAMAAPAMAQTADPLGLIASGAVIPYVGATTDGLKIVNSATGSVTGTTLPGTQGSLAILELASPVGSNAPPEESAFGARSIHMFFFDQTCTRVGPSLGAPETVNGSSLINLSLVAGIPSAGLIALGAVDNTAGENGFLQPLSNPIHARVYWINVLAGGMSRVLEPISISNPEALSVNATWNPLRTGATFLAPLEGSGVHTTLYLACPTQSIIPGPFPEGTNAEACAFGKDNCFPELRPLPVSPGSATPLFLAVYNDEERFVRNIHIKCNCWGAEPVGAIDPVYSDADPVTGVPNGSYTEVYGEPACRNGERTDRCSFTGYRSIQWGAGGLLGVGNDLFGRLSNGSVPFLQGLAPININFPTLPPNGNPLR